MKTGPSKKTMEKALAPASVIVYGPAGCGKSTNAERMRKHFGLNLIVDEFHPLSSAQLCGVLYLTGDMRAPKMRKNGMVKVMSYAKVMAEIEAAAPAEPTTLEKLIAQAPNLALTGWIPCTTPPVREGEYDLTASHLIDLVAPIRMNYSNGEWLRYDGQPFLKGTNVSRWSWRGVRRWVLTKPDVFHTVQQVYLRSVSDVSLSWSGLDTAMGFDTELEANAILAARWPFSMRNAKAVLP